ncbi:MAG: plasmid partitioning protein RepB [Methylocystis sp.]|uniref:plasmid partitioning protein RepB n=1 Tax=Methylocystis sp. TaxID=1911079 RepID=UPI003DA39EB8
MSRRNLLTNLLGPAQSPSPALETKSAGGPADELAAANSAVRPRAPAGAVRAMSLTLDRIEEESRALRVAMATGASVVEIDPAAVDPAFLRDRLAEPEGPDFEALKESIRLHGQTVPILLRPHPTDEGRFQAVYGHRRLRAAQELGIKARAVVRVLDDRELVLAQGIENSARRDLSFIERALFALALETSGYDRPVIMAALSTDKTELSKMLTTARALPAPVVRAIGPAPRAGRRRWMQFAELMKSREAARRAEIALAGLDPETDTDARFLRALAAAEAPAPRPAPEMIRRADGAPLARMKREGAATVLRFDEKAAPEFAEFVAARLAGLYEEFRRRD